MNELHDAARKGNLAKMNELITADANSIKALHSEKGLLPIAYAALGGKLAAFELLLSKNSPTDNVSNEGYPLIFYACAGGNIEIVRRLLSLNHSLNAKGKNGETVIHTAAGEGQTDMVKFLLTQGVPCFVREKEGLTPLHCAAIGNHISTMKVLNEQGKLPYELLTSFKDGKIFLSGGAEAQKFVRQQLGLIELPTLPNPQQPSPALKVSTVPPPAQNMARTVTPTFAITTPVVKELQTTIQNQQRRIADLEQQVIELNKDKEDLRKDKEDLRKSKGYLETQLMNALAQSQPDVADPKTATPLRPSWAPNFHHSTSSTLPSVFSHSIELLESDKKDGSHSGDKHLLEKAETPQAKWSNSNSQTF